MHRAHDPPGGIVLGVRDASARVGGVGQATKRIVRVGPGLAAGVRHGGALSGLIVGVAGRAPGRVGSGCQVTFRGVGVAGHAAQRVHAARHQFAIISVGGRVT